MSNLAEELLQLRLNHFIRREKRLLEILAEHMWEDNDGYGVLVCRYCGVIQNKGDKHKPPCPFMGEKAA